MEENFFIMMKYILLMYYLELYHKNVFNIIFILAPSKVIVYVMSDEWKISKKEWVDLPSIIPKYDEIDDNTPIFKPSIRYTYPDGDYIEEEAEEGRDSQHQIIFTASPPINKIGKVIISLTLNGVDYTSQIRSKNNIVDVYAEPTFNRIVPGCKPLQSLQIFTVNGSSIIESKNITITFFTMNDKPFLTTKCTWIDEEQLKFSLMDSTFEGECYAKIRLNDVYTKERLPFFFYRFPRFSSCFPEYGCSHGGTKVRLTAFLEEVYLNYYIV